MHIAFPPRRRAQGGFTLIELMIAVAIVGILLRLAYPAYTASVKKSRRADAKTALLDVAQREERYLATTNVYTVSAPAMGYATGTTITTAAPMSVLSGSKAYYEVAVSMPTTTQFIVTASPIAGTAQTQDTQCGSFSIDNTGKQSITGTGSAADCW
jgi:type IV pilus assembly protein PilE